MEIKKAFQGVSGWRVLLSFGVVLAFAMLPWFANASGDSSRFRHNGFNDDFIKMLAGGKSRVVGFQNERRSYGGGGMMAAEGPDEDGTYTKEEYEEREARERDLYQKAEAEYSEEANRRAQNGPTVKPVMTFYGESQTLLELSAMNRTPVSPENGPLVENETEKLFEEPLKPGERSPFVPESYLQQTADSSHLPTPVTNFEGPGEGMPNYNATVAPPDTTLAVGPNHVVAWVNSRYAVFSKSGTPLLGGDGYVNGNTLFTGVGNVCETTNRGDPILQYDRAADRWILSQFAFNTSGGSPIAPYLQCIAVSTTNNPTGSYFRYSVTFSATSPSGFNDYGKLGIWPDGYYIAYNMFGGSPAGSNTGAGLCVSDRTKMLAGDAGATTLCAPIAFYGGGGSFLPADVDGSTPPTDVSQGGMFIRQSTTPSLRILKLKPDFTGGTVTLTDGFGGAAGSFINVPLPTTTRPCNGTGGTCVEQPGTANRLDTLGSRLMYRAAYRNRAGVDSLMVAQSVDPDGAGTRSAAMRWYEIRSPLTAAPTLFQNGTFDPGGTGDRWMGSVAMDGAGNMMMGYSLVNAGTSLKPSIAITGRLAGDPANTMQAETIAVTGVGSQTGTLTRWGDYTTIQIDPTDDATFWFIGQYLAEDGTFNWRTRIISYKFGAGPTPTPTSTPTATPTGTPTATPTPGSGFESDVATRPNGDGVVLSGDVIQMRRFSTGLDTPSISPNEFQRADSAPRGTLGDGSVSSGDVIQARRYATGLDPATPAGGPTGPPPVPNAITSIFEDVYAYFFGREMRVTPQKPAEDGTVTVAVEITPYGDEVAAGFTLEYDSAKLSNPR
ncbi:MAG: hypothetical protein WBO10_00640, partial [Pyrinomonadaceae bacterium]